MVLSTFLLTGCWSRIEINDRAFVTGIYIDKRSDRKLDLTLAFPLPNRLVSGQVGGSPSSSGNPYDAVTYSGKNITNAYMAMQADLPRKITWGHSRMIVISEEMAKDGITEILEFVARQPNVNINNTIMVTSGKARDIEYLVPALERFPSQIIRKFSSKHLTLDTTAKDFLETQNGDMVVSILTKKREKMLSEKGKKELWVGTDGVALFHNNKMVGKLGTKELHGVYYLKNMAKNTDISIESPTDKGNVSLLVLQSNTKIRPSKKEAFTFDIAVKVVDDLAESDSNIDLADEKNIHLLEKAAEKKIKDSIEAAFKSSQKMKADVFQLGAYLSWYKPKIWKKAKEDWSSIYHDKVKLNIVVDLKIKRYGSENNPIWQKEQRR
jgi:spore germination protein KC